MINASTRSKKIFRLWMIVILIFLSNCKKEKSEATPENNTIISQYSLTAKPIKISEHISGYYEYLPEGYLSDASSAKYPLLIVFHGAGQRGQNSTSLDRLLLHGPLKLIKNGTFPKSFLVNNITYKFIIISPQFTSTDDAYPGEVDRFINYAKQNYKVDDLRIYLTGMSFGGGISWNYVGASLNHAKKIAAMIPVAAFINESRQSFHLNHGKAQAIVDSNLPVWSTHNSGDNICPLVWTTNVHNLLKNLNSNPSPRLTVFNDNTHEGWTRTYDPSFRENGMNIYEWMLQFHR